MRRTYKGKVSLSKRPYHVMYSCCSVSAVGLEVTPCWSCGKATGQSLFSFYDHTYTNSTIGIATAGGTVPIEQQLLRKANLA